MANRRYLPLHAVVALTVICGAMSASMDRFCYPGQSCFPSYQELMAFGATTMHGHGYLPNNPTYDAAVLMHNVRTLRFPYGIITPNTTKEVQKAVLFARKYNLRMTVLSSGHDYFGRSTGDGTFQINMRNISGIHVNLDDNRHQDGVVKIGSGAPWIKVYEKLDAYKRVVIGGSIHTVAMGGYTHGGGHSPMSRMFGLAVDNLLEVELVLADGSLAVANADGTEITQVDGSISQTSDASLFWALRGGGGGTFGISTNFTFKLHRAALSVVNVNVSYPMVLQDGQYIGDRVLEKMTEIILTAPPQWGGYFLINGLPDPATNTVGSIGLFGNHYGDWDTDSRRFMDRLYNYEVGWQKFRLYTNYSTFLDYERTVSLSKYYRIYLSNILMNKQSFTSAWRTAMLTVALTSFNNSTAKATGTWIGGKVQTVGIHETAVHPGFRDAYCSMSTELDWAGNGNHDDDLVTEGRKIMEKLRPFGHGSYRNEGSADSPSWKDDFWGSNYDRLLAIKRTYDPDNVFTCIDCVGNDE